MATFKVDDYFEAGRYSFKQGRDREDCPYHDGTVEECSWDKGWMIEEANNQGSLTLSSEKKEKKEAK